MAPIFVVKIFQYVYFGLLTYDFDGKYLLEKHGPTHGLWEDEPVLKTNFTVQNKWFHEITPILEN
jgi:hypothetical protein